MMCNHHVQVLFPRAVTAQTLRKHCVNISQICPNIISAQTMRKDACICANIAQTLRKNCSNYVQTMRTMCKLFFCTKIVQTLLKRCANVAQTCLRSVYAEWRWGPIAPTANLRKCNYASFGLFAPQVPSICSSHDQHCHGSRVARSAGLHIQ
jgi:hypothetical protein